MTRATAAARLRRAHTARATELLSAHERASRASSRRRKKKSTHSTKTAAAARRLRAPFRTRYQFVVRFSILDALDDGAVIAAADASVAANNARARPKFRFCIPLRIRSFCFNFLLALRARETGGAGAD